MNIFLDTSSLFKLYHYEDGTDEILRFFQTRKIGQIYLAELAILEFGLVVWKKCRMRLICIEQANLLLEKFHLDCQKFTFVEDNLHLKMRAGELLKTYWHVGLRTLDSIQLASVLSVKERINYLFTADKILSSVAMQESLKVFE